MIRKVPALIFIFLIFNAHYTQILSNYAIEFFELYITEQGVSGFKTGATLRLLLYEYIFFITFIIFSSYLSPKNKMIDTFNKRKNYINKNYNKAIPIVFTVLFLLILNVLASREIPLFSHNATRFNFWSEYARIPVLASMFGTLSVFIPIYFGIYYYEQQTNPVQRATYKINTLVVVCIYIFYLVLVGQKAGGLVIGAYLYIVFYVFKAILSDEQIVTKTMIFRMVPLVILIGILVAVYYRNSGLGDYFDGNILYAILYRIFGLQGHIWWGTDYNYFYLNESGDLSGLINGMQTLMLHVSGDIGQSFIDENIRFANANPALLLYSFGFYLGMLAQTISAVILAFIVCIIINNILSKKYILALISTQILFWLNSFYVNGDLSVFYSGKMVVAIIVYILLSSEILLLKKRQKVAV